MDHTNDTHVAYHLSVKDAAARLGLSEAAVRQRLKRGTLERRHKEGRLFVVLSQDILDAEKDRQNRTTVRSRTMPRTMQDSASENSALSVSVERSGEAGTAPGEGHLADFRRQITRLEGQVDGLQVELRETHHQHAEAMRHKDDQHAEVLRRQDVLLQGYQNQVENMAKSPQIEQPRKSLADLAEEQRERDRQEVDSKAEKAVLGGIVEVLGRLMRRVT